MEKNENSRRGVKAILKLGKDSRVEIGGDQVRIFGEVMVKGSVLETKSLANSGIKVSQKAGGRDRGASASPIPPLDWLPYVLKHTWGGLDGFIAYLRLPRLPGSYPSV